MVAAVEGPEQEARRLEEEVHGQTAEIKEAGKDILRFGDWLDGEFAKQIESLYNHSRKTDYMAEVLDKVPKESRKHFVYMLREEKYQLKSLRDLLKKYSKTYSYLKKTISDLFYLQSRDAIQSSSREGPKYKELENRKDYLANELKLDLEKIKSSAYKFMTFKKTFEEKLQHYQVGKDSKLAHAVPIAISVGFAGLVLYTLSQINPENVTVGAFFAGSNSSVLLTMLSAVVIFLLFFLTHHKLK